MESNKCESVTYWGILGAGRISHDFVNALQDPTGPAAQKITVVAVAASDLSRAQEFARRHGISIAYGSYDELANNKQLSIVYVGNTTAHHYQVCELLLKAGKHVVCEKALTLNAEMSKKLYKLAASQSLFLMEALWSNFLPVWKEIKKCIVNGDIGTVLHVHGSFGKNAISFPSLHKKELGASATLALGVYLINAMRIAFGDEKPETAIVHGNLYRTGIDANWDAIFSFKNGGTANLSCSLLYKLDNSIRISGTKGVIEIPEPFHGADRALLPSGEISIPSPTEGKHDYNFSKSGGLAYQAVAASEAIAKGKLECEEYTSENSLYIAEITDEIRRQVGCKFDGDTFH